MTGLVLELLFEMVHGVLEGAIAEDGILTTLSYTAPERVSQELYIHHAITNQRVQVL